MTLNELKLKESATILRVGGNGALRQHFLDMGMIPGVEVTLEKTAPMGDPVELRLHGFTLALRLADAEKIEVTPASMAKPAPVTLPGTEIEHPGLGEGGRYHEQDTPDKENRKKPKRTLTLALVGNQNCGKTTLFNQLTGAKQHVGNFPGVTVERKDGLIKGHPDATVTDLPGIYSLSPYTSEEVVTRQFILSQHPSGIINIVDATNLERNL